MWLFCAVCTILILNLWVCIRRCLPNLLFYLGIWLTDYAFPQQNAIFSLIKFLFMNSRWFIYLWCSASIDCVWSVRTVFIALSFDAIHQLKAKRVVRAWMRMAGQDFLPCQNRLLLASDYFMVIRYFRLKNTTIQPCK